MWNIMVCRPLKWQHFDCVECRWGPDIDTASSDFWLVFNPDASSAAEADVFGLNGQIEHKLAFLRKHVPRETSLVLVGHSIGCYIILELMKRDPELKVSHHLTVSLFRETHSVFRGTCPFNYGEGSAEKCLLQPLFVNTDSKSRHAVSHHWAHGSDSSGEGHDPGAVSHALCGLPASLPALSAAWEPQSQPDQTGVWWNPLSGPHCGSAYCWFTQWRLCRLVVLLHCIDT